MANFTENYNLEKPNEDEKYNINVFNSNADIIDNALASKLDADATDNFATETSLQNLDNKIGNYSDDGTSSVFSKINSIDTNIDKILDSCTPAHKQISHIYKTFTLDNTTNIVTVNGSGYLLGFVFSLSATITASYNLIARIILDDGVILDRRFCPRGNTVVSYANGYVCAYQYRPRQNTSDNNFYLFPNARCAIGSIGRTLSFSSAPINVSAYIASEMTDANTKYHYLVANNPIPFNESLIIQCYTNGTNTATTLSSLDMMYIVN